MSSKTKSIKISQIFILIVVAIVAALIMSLSAYAMAPTAQEVAQMSTTSTTDNAKSQNNNLDASTHANAENNTETNADKSSGNSSQNANENTNSSNTDTKFTTKEAQEFNASLESNNIKISDLQISKSKNSQDTMQDTQILPQQNKDIEDADYPEKYDLRDVDGKNYVTPVKLQNPWMSCWAFAVISAAESSILTSLGQTYEQAQLDLSEHHLTWFTRKHIPTVGEEGYDENDPQSGEGIYSTESSENNPMGEGLSFMGTTSFGSGFGPVPESYAPYRGVIGRVIAKNNQEYESEEAARAENQEPFYYSSNDDWSLSESVRRSQSYKLEESNILPEITPTKDDSGKYNKNEAGISKIKNEILEGKGVTIGYAADTAQGTFPDHLNQGRYINTKTWSHCTWDASATLNHGVTIVGWDDEYDASNFTITPTKWDENHHGIFKLNDNLEGKDLENDEQGNPIYVKNESTGKYLTIAKDDIQYLLDDTGQQDENGYEIYKGKKLEFENNSEGAPYFPDGNKTRLLSSSYSLYYLCASVKEDFTKTPDGPGAWIVKNSWGASSNTFPNNNDWGYDGFFYISYYDMSIQSPESFEFITENIDGEEDYSLAFGYDFMPNSKSKGGNCSQNDYSQYSIGNQFITDKDTIVNYVSCNTCYEGTTVDFDVYIQDDNASNPIDGELVSQKTQTFTYSGYHRIKLDNEVCVPAGKRFSIVCTLRYTIENSSLNSETKFALPVSMAENQTYPEIEKAKMYTKGVINNGESFVVYKKANEDSINCIDWKEYINTSDFDEITKDLYQAKEQKSYFDFDNVAIKAYGHYTDSPQPSPQPSSNGTSDSTANSNNSDTTEVLGSSASTSDLTPFILFVIVLMVACAGTSICLINKKRSIKAC